LSGRAVENSLLPVSESLHTPGLHATYPNLLALHACKLKQVNPVFVGESSISRSYLQRISQTSRGLKIDLFL
ncbi:hypothetical protein BDA96_04G094800, partial [Sorghum bicolor]